MANLEQLSLTGIQNVVNSYRNLFYHRTVILEGIRKIAFRNMAHLTEAMDYCDSNGNTRDGYQWIEAVQQKMLADQGLEDSELNRTLIGWATYYPLQVYLALIYAEVEFYRKFCANSDVLTDDVFSAYLDTKTEFISKLSKFRDFYLHPTEDNAPAELDFLRVEGSYNHAPGLQKHLDEYLIRTRLKVRDGLKSILFSLPEIERLNCTKQFLGMNFKRMEDYGDVEGMEHVVAQLEGLQKQMAQVPEEIRFRPPTRKQMKMSLALAGMLNEVSPSGPEQQFTNLEAEQTPMATLMLSSLVSDQAPHSYGNSRNAVHVTKNVGLLRRIMITAGVLLNEGATIRGKHTPEQITERATIISSEEFAESHFDEIRQNGHQFVNEMVSLYRVSTALLYEPLRLYAEIVTENREISKSRLDRIATPNRRHDLKVYRNSVFHVLEPRKHLGKVDLGVVDPTLIDDIAASFDELIGFFGTRKSQ